MSPVYVAWTEARCIFETKELGSRCPSVTVALTEGRGGSWEQEEKDEEDGVGAAFDMAAEITFDTYGTYVVWEDEELSTKTFNMSLKRNEKKEDNLKREREEYNGNEQEREDDSR